MAKKGDKELNIPRKGPLPAETPADYALITQEDRDQILQEAQDKVWAERKAAALAQLRAEALEAERRKGTPDEEQNDITIDLPEFAAQITIDGVQYFHGYVYTVGYSLFQSMSEIMSRAWAHQNEIEGRSRFKPVARNISLSPHGIGGIGI